MTKTTNAVEVKGVLIMHGQHPYWALPRDEGWQVMCPATGGPHLITMYIPRTVMEKILTVKAVKE